MANAPLCRTDLADVLCAWVDKIGAKFPKDLTGAARHARDNPMDNTLDTHADLAILKSFSGGVDAQIRQAPLFYLLNEPIKQGIGESL